MEFVAGLILGALLVTIVPLFCIWISCRVMGGKFNNSMQKDQNET